MAGFFGTRQNNENDTRTKSVNTRVYQFKNKEGFEPSTLQVGGWDEMFSMRINPTLPPEKQSRDHLFDYERFVATSFNMEKALLFLFKINKDILPAIENDEEKNIGISVGGDSLVTIGTGKSITNSIRPYIAIHKGLNPDTKKPEQSIYYEFRKSITIDDYNPETGEYTVSEEYDSELNLFCELLKSFIQNSNFNAHVNRFNNRFANEKNFNTMNAIAAKVGADTNTKYDSSNSRRNVFGGTNSYNNHSKDTSGFAAMEELGDLNSLNELMNA